MIQVPFVDLAAQEAPLADDVLAAIGAVAREAKFILGPHVESFERWLACECEVPHAVGVASGSDALELSLRALGIGPGDAVVTPALSYVATAEAIVAAGARPVFCDVDPDTMNASPRTIEQAIDRARAGGLCVRGVMPVHLFGRCGPLEPLRALARRENLALVEDAAQAIGARDERGDRAGSVGDAGCFSFFPTKNLGAWGDGGAVVTHRDDVVARVRRLRAHGAVKPYVHPELGRNSRLDAIQAAVLLAKTGRLASWQEARLRAARRYREELAHLSPSRLTLPDEPAAPAVHVWHAFVVRSDRRDALCAWLRDHGIEARVYYPVPLHRQGCFEGLREPALPEAEAICRTALALPIFTAMSEEQQSRVIEAIDGFFQSL
ncbi:MAG: DegT/DnrJ/EryC1/StrS family aminotransferase [Polyangiaceae bacterium]